MTSTDAMSASSAGILSPLGSRARERCRSTLDELQLYVMSVLTVRLSEEEKKILARRSRQAGMKRSTFVRQLIREQPYTTAADLLDDVEKQWGNEQLRVAPSRRK